MKRNCLLACTLTIRLAAQGTPTYEAIELDRGAWPYIIFKESGVAGARVQAMGGKFVVTSTTGGVRHFVVNTSTGFVGVGTESPADLLEVASGNRKVGFNTVISGVNNGGTISLSRPDDGAKTMLIGTTASPADDNVVYSNGGGTEFRLVSNGGPYASAGFGFYNNISAQVAFGSAKPTPVLKIDGNGNVGIGTISPDSKLTVKGDIHTREVKVDLAGAVGPDYVFEKDYPLTSLEELKSYINQNKHLPEIPSAKEMEEEGINLKEMNLLLLKKVEELTLYVIEQNKELSKQQIINEDLASRITQIEKEK